MRRASRRHRKRHHEVPELDVTAFMNLMVVLIPFLLMMAVFTQLSRLQLKLPELGPSSHDDKKPKFELIVTIHKDSLLLADNRNGAIKRFNKKGGKHDFAAMNKYIAEIKIRHEDTTKATILAQSNTKYDTIIQVMDVLRMQVVLDEEGKEKRIELFPDISLGDAAKR